MVPSILIVGAGPSGLVLALSLLLNGVSVRIIDKEISHRIGERGAGIMPRTLELHNLLGTLPDILKIADDVPKCRNYELPGGIKVLLEQDVVTPVEPTPHIPHANPLIVGQNHLEAILRTHIENYGVKVELATKLEDFEQYDDHVTVTLIRTIDSNAIPEVANFSYLVGADGARSIVRKKLGLSFLGETVNGNVLKIGDIIMKEGLSGKFWHFWGDFQSKMVTLRPSSQDPDVYSFWIVGVDISHVIATSGRQDLINAIEEITGRKDFVFGDIIWINDYRFNIRMVDHFHVGRVFIAGDAAHCHSPTGGQGMNSSSQDSLNLGWKLALVEKGQAPPSLLDTYDEERIPVIAEMLNKTTAMMNQVIKPRDEKEKAAAWNRGSELYMLGVNYRTSSIVVDDGSLEKFVGAAYNAESVATARAGDRAPDATGLLRISPMGEETSLFRLYGPSHHTILAFGGSEQHHTALLTMVSKLPDGLVKSILIFPMDYKESVVPRGFDVVLVDSKGHASAGYSITDSAPSVFAIRPDGVVGARVRALESLERYFSKLFIS